MITTTVDELNQAEIFGLLERAGIEQTVRDLSAARLPPRVAHGRGAWEFEMDAELLKRVIEA
jgi:hypothetical protein